MPITLFHISIIVSNKTQQGTTVVNPECTTQWRCEEGGVLESEYLGGCAEHASCIPNDDGVRECSCDAGFIGDGTTECHGENDCAVNSNGGVVYVEVNYAEMQNPKMGLPT